MLHYCNRDYKDAVLFAMSYIDPPARAIRRVESVPNPP